VAEIGVGGGEWSVVRSRKRKAIQPAVGTRDRSWEATRSDNAGSGLGVRKSRVCFAGLHRSSQGAAGANSSQGNTSKRGSSQDTQWNRKGQASGHDGIEQHGSVTGNVGHKVSYYFTNFPECLPIFLLRQQFEVCGILTNVFIARQGNARGQVYDFVRFSNVKNPDKLSLALNNVWFGHLRVWVREAKYDRFAANDNKPLLVSKYDIGMVDGNGAKDGVGGHVGRETR